MAPNPEPTNHPPSRGTIWVVSQSVLMLAVVLLGVIYQGEWSRSWMIAAGAALFLVGGVIGIAGVAVLGRNRTPFPEPREGSQLVQHGVYARMRHPLYTSVVLASLGWVLIWQSVPAAGAALVLVPFFVAKSRHEERWLRARFPGYADYARRVPAFLPRFRPKPRPAR
jgi:protein-S-isoprenylcysteine O-methyltransferase Ste14